MTYTLPGSAWQGLRSGWPDDTAPFGLAAPAPTGGWSVAQPQGPDPTQPADDLAPHRAAVRALNDLSNRWLQASSAAGQPLNDPRARLALAKLFGGSAANASRAAPPAADGAAGSTSDDAGMAGDADQGAAGDADGSFELAAARQQGAAKPSQARQVPPTRLTQAQIAELETNLKNPNVQAFLSTIANTEGGTYNSLFGDRLGGKRIVFTDDSRYPGYHRANSPSGRYQMIAATYDGLAPKLGLTDFSPHTQDLLAAQLLTEQGAMAPLLAGKLDEVLPKIASQWSSLPKSSNNDGCDPNERPVPYDRVRAIFDLNRSP
jgi:muramidase (phage lysozyme)